MASLGNKNTQDHFFFTFLKKIMFITDYPFLGSSFTEFRPTLVRPWGFENFLFALNPLFMNENFIRLPRFYLKSRTINIMRHSILSYKRRGFVYVSFLLEFLDSEWIYLYFDVFLAFSFCPLSSMEKNFIGFITNFREHYIWDRFLVKFQNYF